MSLEKAEEGRSLQKSDNPLCYCYAFRGQGIFAGSYDNQKIITSLPQQQEFWKKKKKKERTKQPLLLWGQGRNKVSSRGD